jgi:hypothetical protein
MLGVELLGWGMGRGMGRWRDVIRIAKFGSLHTQQAVRERKRHAQIADGGGETAVVAIIARTDS